METKTVAEVAADSLPIKPKKEDYAVGKFVAMTAESRYSPFPTVVFGRVVDIKDTSITLVMYKTSKESPADTQDEEDGEGKLFVTDYIGIVGDETRFKIRLDSETGYANLSMCKRLHEKIRHKFAFARYVLESECDSFPSRVSYAQYRDSVEDAEDQMAELGSKNKRVMIHKSCNGSAWKSLCVHSGLSLSKIEKLW